jgi:hypothetical protein
MVNTTQTTTTKISTGLDDLLKEIQKTNKIVELCNKKNHIEDITQLGVYIAK